MKYLVPYLTVRDAKKSIDFYRDAFGFELHHIGRNQSDSIIHVEMQCSGLKLMFAPEGACDDPSQSPLSLGIPCPMGIYAYCDNVDERYHQAIKAGAKSRSAPKDKYWGERMCEVEDLDGYQWYFTKALSKNNF